MDLVVRDDLRSALALSGEATAAAYLRRKGFVLLARRFRNRYGEIDLIALDGHVVVFVEVKTHRYSGGRPAQAVTPEKQRRIGRVALAWLARQRWLDRECRFDVVEVAGDELRHLVDAFRLSR